MGVVYEAQDPQLRRTVALKVVRELDAGPEHVARLRREATIAAQLRHPNIVGILEVGSDEDALGTSSHFIAMDYIEGKTLASILKERSAERADLVRVLEDVANAVAFAHGKGVVHRDLKPSNVLVEKGGRVVLTDFGLAYADLFSSRLTRTETVMGTPSYMAPEQVEGRNRHIDGRTDVYALGAMLYEIVTGAPPFVGATLAQLYHKIVHADPVPPRIYDKDVDRGLELVCLKALEKEPSQRYPTAQALAEDLGRIRRGEPVAAQPPSVFHRLRRFWKRKRMWAGGILALAAVGLGAFLVMRQGEFARARREALDARARGEWERAVAAGDRALALREDAGLRAVVEEGRREIERARLLRRTEDRFRPLERRVFDLRRFFYMPMVDIRAKIAELESALAEQEAALGEVDSPAARRILGIGWYVVGDVRRAERLLLRAHALDPRDAGTRYFLGRIYLERSFLALVRSGAESIRLRAAQARLWTDRAFVVLQGSDATWEGARPIDLHLAKTYRAAAELDRGRVSALCDEGLRTFGREPGAEEYWILRARFRTSPAASVEDCTQAIALRAHYALGYLLRALYRGVDQRVEILRDSTAAATLQPRWAPAFHLRGVVRYEQRDWAAALTEFNRALELEPDFGLAYVHRALALTSLGRDREALADIGRALFFLPNLPQAYGLRAALHSKSGRWVLALRDFDQAIEADPGEARLFLGRGAALMSLRAFERAERDFSEALLRSRDADSSDARLSRGNVRAILGRWEGALAEYDAALRTRPRFAPAYVSRGLVWERLSRSELAVEDFSRAIALEPSLVQAWFHRGRVRALLGEREKAIDDLEQARKRAPSGWRLLPQVERLLEELRRER